MIRVRCRTLVLAFLDLPVLLLAIGSENAVSSVKVDFGDRVGTAM